MPPQLSHSEAFRTFLRARPQDAADRKAAAVASTKSLDDDPVLQSLAMELHLCRQASDVLCPLLPTPDRAGPNRAEN